MSSLKKDKFKDHFKWDNLFYLLITALIAFFNPVSILLVALVISCVYFLLNLKTFAGLKRAIILFYIIYASLLSVYSISPYLQLQEFKLSHRDWKQQEGAVKGYNVLWRSGTRGSNQRAAAKLEYSYSSGDSTARKTKNDALVTYYPFFIGKTQARKERIQNKLRERVEEHIQSRDFVIMVNPANEESELFMSTEKILWTNSFFYSFFGGLIQIALVIVVFVIAFSFFPNVFK